MPRDPNEPPRKRRITSTDNPKCGRGKRFFADKAKEEEFFEALYLFCCVTDACQLVGVDRKTIERERKSNPEFAARFYHAKKYKHFKCLQLINSVALEGAAGKRGRKQEWRAAAWILERENPQRWGRKDPNAVTPEMIMGVSNGILSDMLEFIPEERRTDAQQKVAARLNEFSKSLTHTDPDDELTRDDPPPSE